MGGPEAIVLVFVLLLPLAGALVFGFVCRSIARRKGRSTASGFCWGFFLGVIGLVVCLSWPEPVRYTAVGSPHLPPGMPMLPDAAPAAPADRATVLTRIALGLGLGVSTVMLLLAVVDVGWPFHRTSWTTVVVALAGVATGISAFVTGHRAAVAACIGSAASVLVPSIIAIGGRFRLTVWFVLGVVLLGGASAALVLRHLASQRDPVARGYPFAPIVIALAFAATSALPAFDRDSAFGWTVAVGVVTLACLGRGRFAPVAALTIAVGYVGSFLEWRDRYWYETDALDLIAGAALLLGSFYLLMASIPLPERRLVRRHRPDVPSPPPSSASWAGPAAPLAAPAATSRFSTAAGHGEDSTIVRPRAAADPAGLPLPPLPTAGLPTYAAPAPAYAAPASPAPAVGDDWFGGAPAAAAFPAHRLRAPADRRTAADRPYSPAWWVLLILFGIVSGIAPLVPFAGGPHRVDIVAVLPYLVVAAATIVAGVVAASGYVSAYAVAAGLAAAWGSMIVVVIWVIVDMIRVAAEFDVSLDVGPGFVLFIVSALLGLIVLIPALVEALRASARRAHPLLGLPVAAGAGMVIVDIVRPRYGSSVFDGDTRYDVSIVVLVAVIGIPALLALLVRTGAAHAIAFGALLLPATNVLAAAIDTYPQLDGLTAWGAALGGGAAAIGTASASERTMRRGRDIVRVPAGGLAIAAIGITAVLVPAVVGVARTASHDDAFGAPPVAVVASSAADVSGLSARRASAQPVSIAGAAPPATSELPPRFPLPVPPWLCDDPPAQLTDEHMEVRVGESFWLEDLAEGDVDGDGVPELAAIIQCNLGPSNIHSAVTIFRADRTPVAAIGIEDLPHPGQDVFKSGFASVEWQPGSFRVEATYEFAPGDSASVDVWLTLIDGALHYVIGDGDPVPIAAVAAGTDSEVVIQANPLALHWNGIGEATFGTDADEAFAYLTQQLGEPTEDFGWQGVPHDPTSDDDQCRVPELREVRWANLRVVFAPYDPIEEMVSDRRTMTTYVYGDHEPMVTDLLALQTERGLMLGDDLARVGELYPDINVEIGDHQSGFVFEPDQISAFVATDGRVARIDAGTEMCPAG